MKLTKYIENAKETLFSFEILPPLKGGSIQGLFSRIEPLMEFKPTFIDVTYHREEFVLRQRPDGLYDKVSLRKRPGTVAICAAIMNKFKVEAVPHIICGGFTRDETENALIDLHFLGIDNVLALRGDNQHGERNFVPEKNGNKNALELIRQMDDMNNGIYLDEELKNPNPTSFCIGAAAYPEKHIDAMNRESDLNFLKQKVDAGAEFATTQMFFDNQRYFDFVDKCREKGILVPIIPGIKPITKRNQLYSLPKIFNIDIPNDLATEMEKTKTDEAAYQVGVEWCVQQCKELKQRGVPVLHFYTMGYSNATHAVLSKVL
ncbi:MAG: methylenetetrahydrofolate reductase [NAD(P)H] [Flavobacteriales bacterium]|nr:methylenetetrahydrofolate reductase [NAD(P)H] [Flavobacteriales bacterium]